MQDTLSPATVPSLAEAKTALTQLATTDALEHLEAALRSLQGLAASLQQADRLPPGEQRELEKALLSVQRCLHQHRNQPPRTLNRSLKRNQYG